MKELTKEQTTELIKILKTRFEKNMNRHKNINWDELESKLMKIPNKMRSLNEMETSGGEPDVVEFNESTKEYTFYDCSKETPINRRNVCYDNDALEARKKFKPENSAMNMAKQMGIEILDEEQYRFLQELGDFDLKTSSWIKTPDEIRSLGGAVFADKRYNTVFIYHNGADSYYGSRGFRGSLKI